MAVDERARESLEHCGRASGCYAQERSLLSCSGKLAPRIPSLRSGRLREGHGGRDSEQNSLPCCSGERRKQKKSKWQQASRLSSQARSKGLSGFRFRSERRSHPTPIRCRSIQRQRHRKFNSTAARANRASTGRVHSLSFIQPWTNSFKCSWGLSKCTSTGCIRRLIIWKATSADPRKPARVRRHTGRLSVTQVDANLPIFGLAWREGMRAA